MAQSMSRVITYNLIAVNLLNSSGFGSMSGVECDVRIRLISNPLLMPRITEADQPPNRLANRDKMAANPPS
jgi:hypothetical protein